MENKRAEHWCTLQKHFAIGGVKTKMSSPSVVRETRGTASTVSNHARTSAVNGPQKFADVPKTTNTQVRVAHVFVARNVFVATTLRSNDRHMAERSHHIARRLASSRAISWRLIRTDVRRTSTKHIY